MLRRLSERRRGNPEVREARRILKKFLEFLSSSIWSIPIASFIEQQSIVFDRQQMETEIYMAIHKEFSVLIDTLIGCFCEDMNIPTEKLGESLQLLSKEPLSKKERISLEPLAAAQNFNVFVPMMMRKNIELQIQALQMIEFMCGLIPNVLQLEDGETLVNLKELSPEDTERYVLISVLRQSKEEFDSLKKGGQEQVQTMAQGSEQQILRLEQEILREESILQRALTDGMKTTSTSSGCQTTDNTAPLSVAAVMISQMANSSTNTDREGEGQSSSTGAGQQTQETMTETRKKDMKDSETNTDRAKSAKLVTSDSQTDILVDKLSGSDEARPKTAKKVTTSSGTETVRPKTAKKTTTSSETDTTRPKTGKKDKDQSTEPSELGKTGKKDKDLSPDAPRPKSAARQNSTGRPPTASRHQIQNQNHTSTSTSTNQTTTESGSQADLNDPKKSFSTSETNTEGTEEKVSRPRPKSAKRVGTSSSRRSSAAEMKTEDSDGKQARPSSKHTSRRESVDRAKIEDRPNTRRSSIDKNTPKRNDSIPSDRRGQSRNGNRKESDDKGTSSNSTLKRPGPVREPRLPGAWPPGEEQVERAESPGADHGPRRRNLGDVHSHLVDPSRLNSSDVRARAEYLRQQRDILLRMKREERIKHINEATKDATERPKTAKAARGMLEKAEAENIRKEIHQKIQTQILTL